MFIPETESSKGGEDERNVEQDISSSCTSCNKQDDEFMIECGNCKKQTYYISANLPQYVLRELIK